MSTKAILTTLAVLGSSTAALADNHTHNNRPITTATPTARREVVSVARPVVNVRPVISRPVATRPERASTWRPVVEQERGRGAGGDWNTSRGRDRDRDGDRDRGHGVVVRRPVVVTPTYYQPTYYQPTYEQPTYEQPTYYQPTSYQASYGSTSGWLDLSAPLALSGGRSAIELDGRGGAIDSLMLQANAGATNIDSIQVVFMDGTSQQFDVRQTIDAGNPELTFEIGHRQVERLIVSGQSGYGASYQILGRD